MAIDDLKPLSYRNLGVSYRILLGTQDITDYFISVDGIDQSLDIDVVSEFTINEARLTMANEDGRFSPRPGNIFETLGYSISGFNVPVIIRCGFEEDGILTDERVFTGKIITVQRTSKSKVKIAVGDIGKDLYDKDIEDFGISKYGKLEEDEDKTSDGIVGNYPFGDVLSPVSDGSVSGTSGGTALVKKDELDREGLLNPLNFDYSDTEMKTEGGPLTTDPIIQCKSPYRYAKIEDIVGRILDHFSITDRIIEIPFIPLSKDTFASNGRIEYPVAGSDPANDEVIRWEGFTTDYICDDTNGLKFYLHSHRHYETLPQIIEYDENTDTSRVLYKHPTHAEFWKIVSADFNTFFVLGSLGASTEDWRDFYYDSAHPGSTVTIWKYDLAADTFEVFLDNTEPLRPQLASLLQLGFNDDLPIGAYPRTPDTNKNLQIYDDMLYYRYANDTTAGVAKIATMGGATTSLFPIAYDRFYNQTSIDFFINGPGGIGYGYINFVGPRESEYRVFSFSI